VTRALRWARPTVAAVALAAVVWRLGTGPFIDGVRSLDARALLAGAGIFFAATTCCAWRWAVVARRLGMQLSLRPAVAAYYRCLFLNVTLPTGVAGDVHRGVSHGRDVHDVRRGLRAVVWERTLGQVVQVALTVVVLLVLPSPARRYMPFVAVALAALAIAVVVGARKVAIPDIRRGLLHRHTVQAIVLTTTVAVLCYASMFVIAARTVGVAAPISRLVPLALLAVLAMVLPSIAGWGPREGATAWMFSAAGLGPDRGAATAVAYGVMVLAASLPGALVLVAGRLPRRFAYRAQGAADA
jgi:glycosyltransferase 2 family protein